MINKMTGIRIVVVLVSAVMCSGCGDKPAAGGDGNTNEVRSGFNVDDVPSLNLPVEKREPGRLWCKEHNRYEDECYICHPELIPKGAAAFDVDDVPSLNLPASQREPGRLWCKEHNRYENECYICHPELIPGRAPAASPDTDRSNPDEAKQEREERAGTAAVLMCKEHHVLETECGICQPDRLAGLFVGEGMKIRFASDLSTSKAGVLTGRPEESSENAPLELLGEVSFNRNQLARVTPLGGGVITEVLKDVGEVVTAGEVLAILHSREIAAARSTYIKLLAEYKLAQLTLKREQDLTQQKISARQDLESAQAAAAMAEAAVTEARQELRNWGLTDDEIATSVNASNDLSSMPLRAPLSGTLVTRNAVVGTAVQSGDELFTVADLSTMWMELSFSEVELSAVRVGSMVQAKFDVYPGISFEGEIAWVAPTVNPDTRKLEARAVLQNPQGLLKDGLFGRASLDGALDLDALTVPAEAVQEVDGKAVVFKKLEEDLFESRLITASVASNGKVMVLAGLAPDDEIVIGGSYIVKSELLKARLGAGCTDD